MLLLLPFMEFAVFDVLFACLLIVDDDGDAI